MLLLNLPRLVKYYLEPNLSFYGPLFRLSLFLIPRLAHYLTVDHGSSWSHPIAQYPLSDLQLPLNQLSRTTSLPIPEALVHHDP